MPATAADLEPEGPRGRLRQGTALALGCLLIGALARAAAPEWRDLESRIQYGYYTEDATSLRNLAQGLAADESHDPLSSYYAALLDWRRAQLTPSGAASLAHHCVSELDAALEKDATAAEALALRAACNAQPLEEGGLHLPLSSYGVHRDLSRARDLAPHNPRVLLLGALSDYQLPSSLGGNKERALSGVRAAVIAFDAERHGTEHVPGWGAAEAYLLLARCLLDHHDTLGAREALEHALLIAPEFAQARRLMTKITAG